MNQTPYRAGQGNDKVGKNKTECEMVCPVTLSIVQKPINAESRDDKNDQGNSQSKPDQGP